MQQTQYWHELWQVCLQKLGDQGDAVRVRWGDDDDNDDVRWLMTVTDESIKYTAPPGCLQWYTGTLGTVQNFNFKNTDSFHLSSQRYNVCWRWQIVVYLLYNDWQSWQVVVYLLYVQWLADHPRMTCKVTGKSVGLFWYPEDIDFQAMMWKWKLHSFSRWTR